MDEAERIVALSFDGGGLVQHGWMSQSPLTKDCSIRVPEEKGIYFFCCCSYSIIECFDSRRQPLCGDSKAHCTLGHVVKIKVPVFIRKRGVHGVLFKGFLHTQVVCERLDDDNWRDYRYSLTPTGVVSSFLYGVIFVRFQIKLWCDCSNHQCAEPSSAVQSDQLLSSCRNQVLSALLTWFGANNFVTGHPFNSIASVVEKHLGIPLTSCTLANRLINGTGRDLLRGWWFGRVQTHIQIPLVWLG